MSNVQELAKTHALVVFEQLATLGKKFTLSTILGFAPKIVKVLVYTFFLANIKSWPLVWHFRIFRPVFYIRFQHLLIRTRMLFMSPTSGNKLEDKWLDSISPVARSPFSVVVPYKTRVDLDDSDFNLHLSNSSYAKIMDGARFKAALVFFPMFFRAGGWLPLAGTHFYFVKEIPMLTSYEIRTSIAAWDQKWMYVLSKFVRKPDGKKKKKKTNHFESKSSTPVNGEIVASIRTPGSEEISTNGTPFISGTPNGILINGVPDLKAVAANLRGEEPDGATLHTVVVSQICFKIGRITVPPNVMLAINGFTGATGVSAASPHPEWKIVKGLMSRPNGGSPKKLKQFLTSGWKDVPEGERWWETALGPEIEAQNLKNLEQIETLRRGMEAGKSM